MFQVEKLVLFQFKFKSHIALLPVPVELALSALMVIIQRMEIALQSQFFVEANTINKQVSVLDVLMDISFKMEPASIQLLESIKLVRITQQVDFATDVHWVTIFLATNVLKLIISAQSLITQSQYVLNVIIKLLKGLDVFEIRFY